MPTALLIFAALALGIVCFGRRRTWLYAGAMAFCAAQLVFAGWAIVCRGETVWRFFTFDALGLSYYCLMALLAVLCCWRSIRYLDSEQTGACRIYLLSLLGLNIALTGVYFANNVTVTWIFLEATSIAAAGLTYHRRTLRSLEATWKYLFVTSVGIAIAYLGVLLLSTAAAGHEEYHLSYQGLKAALAGGEVNMLYMKLAFVFILVGYSSKLELFPFYTVGVDANHSAPAPASAFISSALVGGGFVALLRVYRMMEVLPGLIEWAQHVLLLVGLLSLLMAAVYLGRTRNFKRLAAYSTVENSGLVAIGLGLGGIGIWAAVLHALAHTLIKGTFLLQLSVVGKVFRSYKTSRIGSYFRIDPPGGLVIAGCLVALLAMPPSVLFRTEYLMLTGLIEAGQWWIALIIALLLLAVIFWLCSKVLPALYKPVDLSRIKLRGRDPWLSAVLLLILVVVFTAGVWMMPQLAGLVDTIAYR